MYPAKPTALGKLRDYNRALKGHYLAALRRRDLAQARRVYELRRRVYRAILITEEYCVGT